MNIYQITYYAAEVHNHDCGHDHAPGESCNHNEEEHHHHHHHSNLPRKIQSLGSWAHVMPTTFLVQTELKANEITASLNEVKQDNETFLVSAIQGNYGGSIHPNALAWIETRLK